jgi:protein O-GlcNAc transferase
MLRERPCVNRLQRRRANKKTRKPDGADSVIRPLFEEARDQHRAGDLSQAERGYRAVLRLAPQHPDALHLLGVLAYQIERYDDSIRLISQAIANLATVAAYHSNLGNTRKAIGQLDQAEASYRRALALAPRDSIASNNLATVLRAQGKLEEAASWYSRALALRPGDPEVLNNQGNISFELEQFEEAETYYRHATSLKPDYSEAHYNLGNALWKQEKMEAAIEEFERALDLQPDDFKTHNNLGLVLAAESRLDEAIAHYAHALDLRPDDPECLSNLADAFLTQRRYDAAKARYEQAIAQQPSSLVAINGLGAALREERRFSGAMALFDQALALDPDSVETLYNKGLTLFEMGRHDEAIEAYRRALAISPNYVDAHNALGLAFTSRGAHDEAILHLSEATKLSPKAFGPFNNLMMCLTYSDRSAEHIFAEHRRFGATHEGELPAPQTFPNDRTQGRRLKIGYVSPDFKHHVTALFMRPLLAAHDHAAVEVYCYGEVPKPDGKTQHFEALADHWLNTSGMSDRALADRIRADGIDILVDVAGHTAGNRLKTLARKPAPIQVTWLGYPNTTGLTAMDYKFVDAETDPLDTEEIWSTETLLRLENGLLCYEPPEEFPQPSPPPCLTNGVITFGSYNNPAKYGDHVLDAWAALLLRVPDSRLVLMGKAFDGEHVRQLFAERLVSRGVDADRLDLRGWAHSAADHYGAMDIALDPFPYNGTTTTCEALWMGTPVVVLRGSRHAGRVSASLLARIGMQDLVADDVDGYIEIASRLAADPARIAELRRNLRARMAASPLCDGPGFARSVERAYREMWRRWSLGDEPSTVA